MVTQAVLPSFRANMGYVQVKAAFKATCAPGAITTGATAIVTPTIPAYVSCDIGDMVIFGSGTDLLGVIACAYVQAKNVIKVAYANVSAGTLTPASSSCFFTIVPQETGIFVA